ncbi:hypothetical protein AVEN_95370-1 [Araneus ventricosus]|uniref:HTH psq-type domain-containing protein n=1 Tax=Araneus ventricosus TaxID=182803 RepID=A0A4Y2CHU9_ARAVE|nr:hypothetical protein AVEN_95370-1 [Araneus ventricosus]
MSSLRTRLATVSHLEWNKGPGSRFAKSFGQCPKARALNMSKKRVILTLEQRIEMIEFHEEGTSERKLEDIFGCGKTQVNKILKDKIMIRKE